MTPHALQALAEQIRLWAGELGFQQTGIADIDLSAYEAALERWLAAGYHGEMSFMTAHGSKRTRPAELVPGTRRVISVRMDYLPQDSRLQVLNDPLKGYVSSYALGRDYHKLVRKRLQQLAERIQGQIGPFGYRAFVDSAPVMEQALARESGLGWIGRNTLLINRQAGSWFFLGELFVDLPLPLDPPHEKEHCGQCHACEKRCPTGALLGDGVMDARRCIAYLTIEYHGVIPEALRPLIGNRIFGCDDCQLACPWNRFAAPTREPDYQPRHGLEAPDLLDLFAWTEAKFLERTAGSPLRRTGYQNWQRNLAVALGNAPHSTAIRQQLLLRRPAASPLVQEHIDWALQQHR